MTPLVVVADGVAWAWSAVEITGGYDLSRADPAQATRDQAEYLDRLLAAWSDERHLIVCDESGTGEPIARAAARLPGGPAALLIGPEGGFERTELDALGKLSFVSRIGLGPRVLRAETAALAALAVYQATAGDWRHTRSR